MTEPLWTITGITDVTTFEQGIGAVQSKRIDFKTMTGLMSFITVSLSQFNKDSVGNKIQEAVQHLIEVQTLEGPDTSAPMDFNANG